MTNSIEKALGLRPLEEALGETVDATVEEVEYLPVANEEKNTEVSITDLEALAAADDTLKDIEKARANVERIIGLGDDSLDELINLAKQSESPRAFEVVSGMMKTLLDANRDFVDLSMRKKYAKDEIINPKKEEEAQTNITNNNLILSTADLLKMIKGSDE